jgi:hypothetical protein
MKHLEDFIGNFLKIFYLVLSLYFVHTCCFVFIVLASSCVFTAQHTTQTYMTLAELKPAIPARERPVSVS